MGIIFDILHLWLSFDSSYKYLVGKAFLSHPHPTNLLITFSFLWWKMLLVRWKTGAAAAACSFIHGRLDIFFHQDVFGWRFRPADYRRQIHSWLPLPFLHPIFLENQKLPGIENFLGADCDMHFAIILILMVSAESGCFWIQSY